MQTIYLDISNKGVVPTVYAKQGDVGRKFQVVLTDSGVPYVPASGSAFSVWYSGASGEGNYTDIGDESAFSVNGNKVIVEMIAQMLLHHGDGVLCLTLNSSDGSQISSWNIPYLCEIVPGAESEKAEEYYTAFSKAVSELPYPDKTLSVEGKAADAAATGAALLGKAPSGYGLGSAQIFTADEIDDITRPGFYDCNETMTIGGYERNRWWMDVSAYGAGTSYATQRIKMFWGAHAYTLKRSKVNGTWEEWGWENPPMEPDKEYRTMEKWRGLAVYTKMVNFGAMPNSTYKNLIHNAAATKMLRVAATFADESTTLPFVAANTENRADVFANLTHIYIKTNYNASVNGASVQIWYTKD